jgi:hypothetical protein
VITGTSRIVIFLIIVLSALGWTAARLIQGSSVQSLPDSSARKLSWAKSDFSIPGRALDLTEIRDRPLMYATRALYVAPPSPQLPSAPPPSYRLVGTLVVPGKPALALLMPPAGSARRIKVGDELDGWKVRGIDVGRVVLELGVQRIELVKVGDVPTVKLVRASLGIRGSGAGANGLDAANSVDPESRLLTASGSAGSTVAVTSRRNVAVFVAPKPYLPLSK